VPSSSLLDQTIAWIVKNQTTLIALYAALVATGVAIWNIYWNIRDRGRLRVIVSRANVFAVGVGDIAKDKLWYKVINVGRQPIWVTHIGGGYRTAGKHFIITTVEQLRKKLEPGEALDDASSDAKNLDVEKVSFLGAWDSFGTIHKLPRRQLKALLKDLQGGEA
jgi:hypothetical protein